MKSSEKSGLKKLTSKNGEVHLDRIYRDLAWKRCSSLFLKAQCEKLQISLRSLPKQTFLRDLKQNPLVYKLKLTCRISLFRVIVRYGAMLTRKRYKMYLPCASAPLMRVPSFLYITVYVYGWEKDLKTLKIHDPIV